MRRNQLGRWGIVLVAAVALFAVACTDDDGGGDGGDGDETVSGDTLQEVLDRGELRCGVKDGQPGFGNIEPDGSNSGNDVEYCKAVATALFGDPSQVEYVLAGAGDRFELLSSGEIDVLIRTTTWTLSRDADLNADFTSTTFYDGQGLMVKADSGITSMQDLDGANICVTTGTTTESNLETAFRAEGLGYTPVAVADDAATLTAFTSGQCDAWTADRSNLAGQRTNYPDGPEAVVILDEVLSKEPLGPSTRDNESEWHDVVQWVVYGMIAAEELGVTSENVDQMAAEPPNANVANLLGVAIEGGAEPQDMLGLDVTFMQDVLREVGNYGEVYERTLEPIGLERAGSLNALWTDGGLIYSPPFR